MATQVEGDLYRVDEGEPIEGFWEEAFGTYTVKPSCGVDQAGTWRCVDHKENFTNNAGKDSHIERGRHTLVWICWQHGYEVP